MKNPSADLLILAYVYPPDNYAGAARPHRLAKYLSRLGVPVRILAAAPPEGCGVFENVHRVRGELDHLDRRDFWAYVEKVFRRFLFRHDEGTTWVPRALNAVRRWRREEGFGQKPVVVFSTSPPVSTHLVAYCLKRWLGVAWIADFRDPLVGNPYRHPGSVKVDEQLERLFFRTADALIANTGAVAEMWRRRYPQCRDKIHVVWNGFDPETSVRAAPLPAERPYRVLSHLGGLYGDRYPHLLIRSLDRLIERGALDPAAIKLRLIPGAPQGGDGAKPWIEFGPRLLPRAEAQKIASEADYLLLLDRTRIGAGQQSVQVPGKTFEYVRIGRPILACTLRGSPVESILERCGTPYCCLYPDLAETEYDRRLEEFLRLPTEPTPASDWFNKQFSAVSQAERILRIMRLAQERARARR